MSKVAKAAKVIDSERDEGNIVLIERLDDVVGC
jgi:hypothetical protein